MLLRNNGYQSPRGQFAGGDSGGAGREPIRPVLLMDLNYARDTTSGREGLDLLAHLETRGDTAHRGDDRLGQR